MIPENGRPHTIAPDDRPGLDPRLLVRLMRAAVERCCLDLTGFTVLTETANGAYAVIPVLAAMAGTDVWALGGNTRYRVLSLEMLSSIWAQRVRVTSQAQLIREKSPKAIGAAGIVTNSGQVRPIDAAMVAQIRQQ